MAGERTEFNVIQPLLLIHCSPVILFQIGRKEGQAAIQERHHHVSCHLPLNPRVVVLGFGEGFVGAVDGFPHDVAHDHVFVERGVAAAGASVAAEAGGPEGAGAVAAVVHAGPEDALDEMLGGVFVLAVNAGDDADLLVDDGDGFLDVLDFGEDADRAEDFGGVEDVVRCRRFQSA